MQVLNQLLLLKERSQRKLMSIEFTTIYFKTNTFIGASLSDGRVITKWLDADKGKQAIQDYKVALCEQYS